MGMDRHIQKGQRGLDVHCYVPFAIKSNSGSQFVIRNVTNKNSIALHVGSMNLVIPSNRFPFRISLFNLPHLYDCFGVIDAWDHSVVCPENFAEKCPSGQNRASHETPRQKFD
ncbi:hypothetical protein V6N12_021992 [Hibiscus sabdariffa]|uniref:Uncharacterized protein n=1 Tax=Hibiscus sabdariffa TaxID=183260 RepID=A0ABR2FTW0_9ROSI